MLEQLLFSQFPRYFYMFFKAFIVGMGEISPEVDASTFLAHIG
jgi:hypothetical protein